MLKILRLPVLVQLQNTLRLLLVLSCLNLSIVLAFQKPSIVLHSMMTTSTKSKTTRTTSNDILTSSNRKLGTITTTTFYTKTSISINSAATSTGTPTTSETKNTNTQVVVKFKNIDDMITELQNENIILYFTSGLCGPCYLQTKELQSVQTIVGKENAYKVLTIDTKKWPHTGTQFAIGKLPCVLVMKNKQIIYRFDGLTPADEFVKKVYHSHQL